MGHSQVASPPVGLPPESGCEEERISLILFYHFSKTEGSHKDTTLYSPTLGSKGWPVPGQRL